MSFIGRGFLGKLNPNPKKIDTVVGGDIKKKLIADTDYRKNFARFKKRTIFKICIFCTVWLAGFVSTSLILIGVGVFSFMTLDPSHVHLN